MNGYAQGQVNAQMETSRDAFERGVRADRHREKMTEAPSPMESLSQIHNENLQLAGVLADRTAVITCTLSGPQPASDHPKEIDGPLSTLDVARRIRRHLRDTLAELDRIQGAL